jgi:hypothetical protein
VGKSVKRIRPGWRGRRILHPLPTKFRPRRRPLPSGEQLAGKCILIQFIANLGAAEPGAGPGARKFARTKRKFAEERRERARPRAITRARYYARGLIRPWRPVY